MAAALCAAALVVTVLLASGVLRGGRAAQPAGPQPGGQDTTDFNHAQRVDASPSHDGITLQVTGFVADETQTVVSYILTGRESEGIAQSGSGVFLIDADGNSYRFSSGTTDSSDRRRETAVFPAIPAKAGKLALQLEDLTILPVEVGGEMTQVSGVWKAEFDWDGKPASPGPTVEVTAAPQPFGPGSITVTSIQQAATETVISGVLDGFTADAIQDMDCMAQPLVTADGASVPWTGCRGGFGDGDRSFEIRYPPTSGKVTLTLVLSFPELHSPPEPTLSPGFAEAAGAKATFELDLPAREN
ncbi:MAG: hypothetical protein ABSC13_05655 [Dehalococcoidia bacterium]